MQDKPEKKTPRTLRLNARDNIIVAVDSVEPGTTVQGVKATARVMRGHKMASERVAMALGAEMTGVWDSPLCPGVRIWTTHWDRFAATPAGARALASVDSGSAPSSA